MVPKVITATGVQKIRAYILITETLIIDTVWLGGRGAGFRPFLKVLYGIFTIPISCCFPQELTTSLQGEEDKANRLSKLKTKLENTIAETNDELEREKRQRGDVEKIRRKLEADLKVSFILTGTAKFVPGPRSSDLWYFFSTEVHFSALSCFVFQATQDTVDNLDHTRMELEKNVSGYAIYLSSNTTFSPYSPILPCACLLHVFARVLAILKTAFAINPPTIATECYALLLWSLW